MNTKNHTSLIILSFAIASCLSLAGQAAADVNKLAKECAECHGQNGASKDKEIPIIGGLSSAYFVQTMDMYKNKKRPCRETKYREGDEKGKKTDMCAVAKKLSEEDIKQLGAYFAGKKFVRAVQGVDPALAKQGAKLHEHKCEKCHSESGSMASDDSGILAGQWMSYLSATMKDYREGKRPMDKKMKPKMDSLKPADVDALVNYYGSFK